MSWFWTQLIIFQLLWITAVIGQNSYVVLCVSLLFIHFVFSPSRSKDLLVLPIAFIGIAIDAILTGLNIFYFENYPIWLIFLWFGFVLSINHSLAWLKKLSTPLIVLIGAISGTASYLAGWRFSAVEFPQGLLISIGVISVVWAFLLPSLVSLDTKLRRIE